jgi:sugar phosphate isomerase/epimerase
LGDQIGVVPQLEIWGFSKTLNRLGEAMLVAIESQHPRACVLLDVYHLYRGGSDFMGLRMLQGSALGVFHMNDYPASPPRDLIADSDRVFPGDGVAPLREIVTSLHQIGYNGYLSIELFNESYWQQDALIVARTALEKTQAIVQQIAN